MSKKFITTQKNILKSQAGFTLVEILVVLGILAITIGVTGDIILTLIRSYTKTEITNDIEQNTNFVSLKLENELKNATSVDTVTPDSLTFTKLEGGIPVSITYAVTLVNGVNSVTRNTLPLTDSSQTSGVAVLDCSANPCFELLSTNPDIVRINMSFAQASNTSSTAFTGDIKLENTIVVKGTY